ncbi:DEAD/DEAH box helicase [Piscinibacter terrae]|uniref:DEAD/DEAH box helicase n=1 Tax=Piscinibacter terrae TaxID=2496871 RepID=A0A3N7HXM1_9BURK|nr:DEAD/DEAH box helicase [Albitalea terrae]RQP25811.1 DEAD/DEAH box helicase [Albitalea terrae]
MNPFALLGLSPALVRAVSERGYAQPTAIQAAAIPVVLAGNDVLGAARTGSGKTAAFALPLVQQVEGVAREAPRRLHALVLVPTRELAAQVGESIRGLARELADPVKVAIVFGGVSINPQMMGLRGGAEVVVATPGRLLDLIDHNALSLSGVALLVLDEADRLLDAGFSDELARVLALLPRRRQNLLFSATFPPAVQALAHDLLHDPVRIEVPLEPDAGPAVEQHAVEVDAARRTPLLRHMIQEGGWTRVLVFVASRYASEHVADKLRRSGIAAAALHGDLSQGARTKALADFKAGRLQVVVATDVAARGIDIAQLPVVVNYDLPRSAVDHVHRIGRTARAGESGLAVSFISAETEAHFRLIEKRQGHRVTRERVAGFEPTESTAPVTSGGGIKGKRKSKKDKLREALANGSSGRAEHEQ